MLTVELVVTIIVEFIVGITIVALANAERKRLQMLRKLLLVVFAVIGVGLIVLVFLGPKSS